MVMPSPAAARIAMARDGDDAMRMGFDSGCANGGAVRMQGRGGRTERVIDACEEHMPLVCHVVDHVHSPQRPTNVHVLPVRLGYELFEIFQLPVGPFHYHDVIIQVNIAWGLIFKKNVRQGRLRRGECHFRSETWIYQKLFGYQRTYSVNTDLFFEKKLGHDNIWSDQVVPGS